MVIKIDFNSDEAIYIQLRNQIIMGIATSQLAVGDSLPSVRQLADYVGINMHTVNKAYSVLRQEGYIKLDRRKGAVIAIDYDQTICAGKVSRRLVTSKGSVSSSGTASITCSARSKSVTLPQWISSPDISSPDISSEAAFRFPSAVISEKSRRRWE